MRDINVGEDEVLSERACVVWYGGRKCGRKVIRQQHFSPLTYECIESFRLGQHFNLEITWNY